MIGWLAVAAIFAGSMAVSYVMTQQAMKKAKKAAADMAGVLVNKESNIEPIPVIYGTRRVGGVRVFVSTKDVYGGDKNEFLYIALAMAEGEVESITNIYIDDEPITNSKFTGLVTINAHTGSDDQAYDPLLTEANAGWTINHRLRGVAYLAIRLKWNEDVFSGMPDITGLVRGRKLYDPRTPSASPAYSNNPALCIRDYLTNSRYGKGLSSSSIDDTLFSSAATDCDDSVIFYQGGPNGTLFECNAVIQTDEELFGNLEKLLMGCRGFLPYSQGLYGLSIDKSGTSVFAFNTDNMIGGISIKGEQKEDKFNRVIAKFANPDVDYQPDEATWPDPGSSEEATFLDQDNGTLLVEELDLDTITNYYAARDMARVILLRSRNSLRTSFRSTSEALQLSVSDIVTVQHPTPGWINPKPFQVENIQLNYDGTCDVALIEYDPSIYTYDLSAQQISYPDTDLPDPFSVAPITNLSAVGSTQLNADGGTISAIEVSFTAAADSFVNSYELTWVSSGGETQTFRINSTEYTIYNLDNLQTYTVSVVAINSLGAKSTSVSVSNVSPSIDVSPPAVPTSVTVTGTFKQIDIAWTNPTDSDFAYIELKRAGTAIEGDAVYIAKTSGDHYIDSPYTSTVTRYYWLRSVDRTGNASEWVSGGGGTAIQLVANDFDDGVIALDFLTSDLQTTIENKVDTSTLQSELTQIEGLIDLKANQTDVNVIIDEVQDVGNTADLVAERMLTLATTQSEQLGIVRDAGITVDPSTGSVTIQAVENLRSDTDTQFSQVTIDLDAAEAEIVLKASVSYVNDAIASAVLDSADLASLNELELKVNQAEIDIDAAEAAILLKADTTVVSGIDVRVGQAEIDIDAAEAAILLKASNTDLNALDDRVETAEIQINALDIPSITQTVVDSRTLKVAIDRDNIRSLKDLLAAYKGRESLRTDLAFAQSSISADVNDNRVATSTQRTELLGLIDENEALILTEQTVRADETSALASSITTLSATVGDNAASIVTEAQARADADVAIVQTVDALSVLVDENAGSIIEESTARADADTVIVQTSQTLLARFGVAQQDTYDPLTTYALDDEVVYLGVVYKALELTTGNTPTNTNYWQPINTVSADINSAVTSESEARVSADEAIGLRIDAIDVLVDENAGEIVNEAQARATADEVIVASSQKLFGRFGIAEEDTYSAATTYATGDEVVYLGVVYKALQATTGNIPTDVIYWEEIATVDADVTAKIDAESAIRVAAEDAIAQSVNTLSVTVAENASLISDEQSARATADAALAQTASTIFAALDIPKADTYNAATDYLVGQGAIYNGLPYICILDSTGNLPTEEVYWSEVETTSGAILDNNTVRIGYCTLDGNVTDAKDKASCELALGTWTSDTAIVTAAKQIKLKQPDGSYAVIETAAGAYADDLGDIRSQYTVTIDNNGNVSGFGLVSDIINGNPTSAFIVKADQFAIGGTEGTAGAYPFVFYAVDTDVIVAGETITIPAGTYIDSANVNYLNANQIEVGELSAQRLQLDDVTMDTDASGNLIIKTGGVGSVQIANLAVTTGKIANLSVDTLKIADQAVTIPSGSTTTAPEYTVWGAGSTEIINGSSYYVPVLNSVAQWRTISSITFTSAGGNVFLTFSGELAAGVYTNDLENTLGRTNIQFEILRDTTVIQTGFIKGNYVSRYSALTLSVNLNRMIDNYANSVSVSALDSPVSGSHTWSLRARPILQEANYDNFVAANRNFSVSALEVKK